MDKHTLHSNQTTVRAINLHFYTFTIGRGGDWIIIVHFFKLKPYAVFVALRLNSESFKCSVNVPLPK